MMASVLLLDTRTEARTYWYPLRCTAEAGQRPELAQLPQEVEVLGGLSLGDAADLEVVLSVAKSDLVEVGGAIHALPGR